MEKEKFAAVMGLLVPQVIDLITEKYGLDEKTAISEFYRSRLYSILEDEETKLWHFSALTLFNMFDEEMTEGTITFPVEG